MNEDVILLKMLSPIIHKPPPLNQDVLKLRAGAVEKSSGIFALFVFTREALLPRETNLVLSLIIVENVYGNKIGTNCEKLDGETENTFS